MTNMLETKMRKAGCPFVPNAVRVIGNSVQVEIETESLNFDQLVWFSKFFGTKNINVNAETREGGYCETCSYTYSVQKLYINNATKGI